MSLIFYLRNRCERRQGRLGKVTERNDQTWGVTLSRLGEPKTARR